MLNLRGFGHNLKTAAEDLHEGKITAPLVRCLMLSNGAAQRYLWEQIQAPAESRDVSAMVEMIEVCYTPPLPPPPPPPPLHPSL